MERKRIWLVFVVMGGWQGAFTAAAHGDLVIADPNTDYVVDFDSSLAGVNEGRFTGSGVETNPSDGQLDADSWSFAGFSSSGDLSRGLSAGGVSTGGLYAFETDDDTVPNVAMGFQATGTDFTPGSITLTARNETGQDLSQWSIDYEILAYNDQNRSTSLNFSYAVGDGSSFTPVDLLDYASPELSDSPPTWLLSERSIDLQIEVADGDRLWLRWTSDDASGTGSRDEIALDNIQVRGNASVPEPSTTGLLIAGLATAVGWRRLRHHRSWVACSSEA